jgi:hypothetical protein
MLSTANSAMNFDLHKITILGCVGFTLQLYLLCAPEKSPVKGFAEGKMKLPICVLHIRESRCKGDSINSASYQRFELVKNLY